MLRVKLWNGTKFLTCLAILDSGADHCVFPRSFMQPLGLDPLTSPVDQSGGVGNSNNPTHFATVALELNDARIEEVYAGFTTGMDQYGIGLLGQVGFFENFVVTFDQKNKVFSIER